MRANLPLTLGCSLAITLFAAGAAPAAPPASAAAAQRNPVHRSLTIDRPGVYALGSVITVGAGETAFVVLADDVTLDCGGYGVQGPGGPGTIGVDVRGASNVAVRNCTFDGLGIGLRATGATNLRLQGSQINGRDLGGTPPNVEIGVLLIDTRGASIADNVITGVFLGVFVRGGGSGGNRIAGNTIAGGDHGELGICYNPAEGAGPAGPGGDLVYNNLVSRFNRGIALSADSRDNVIVENTLAAFVTALQETTPGSNVIEDNHVTQPTP